MILHTERKYPIVECSQNIVMKKSIPSRDSNHVPPALKRILLIIILAENFNKRKHLNTLRAVDVE